MPVFTFLMCSSLHENWAVAIGFTLTCIIKPTAIQIG